MLCKCSGKYIDIYFNLKITFLQLIVNIFIYNTLYFDQRKTEKILSQKKKTAVPRLCVCVYIYMCVCIYICTLCIHTHVRMHVYLLCIAYVRELEPPTFRGPENSPLHAVSCAYVQHQLCIHTHASHTHIHHDAHTHVRWEKHAKSALGSVLP